MTVGNFLFVTHSGFSVCCLKMIRIALKAKTTPAIKAKKKTSVFTIRDPHTNNHPQKSNKNTRGKRVPPSTVPVWVIVPRRPPPRPCHPPRRLDADAAVLPPRRRDVVMVTGTSVRVIDIAAELCGYYVLLLDIMAPWVKYLHWTNFK